MTNHNFDTWFTRHTLERLVTLREGVVKFTRYVSPGGGKRFRNLPDKDLFEHLLSGYDVDFTHDAPQVGYFDGVEYVAYRYTVNGDEE